MRKLIDLAANSSPWLVFMPFLILYLVLTQALSTHEGFLLDEARYWEFAHNLLNGHFHGYEVGRDGYQFLWNGPGYPIFLMPFAAFDSPSWIVRLSNAFFLYMAVVYLFKMLTHYVPRKNALFFALAFAAYFPMYNESLAFVMTEAMTIFLTSVSAYLVSLACIRKDFGRKSLALIGLALAGLALTKVLFGYVLLAMIFSSVFLGLISGRRREWFQISKMFGLGLAFCIPYLIYTFTITGKPFYWSNAGGVQLYWMSSLHPDELGDWHSLSLDEGSEQHLHHDAFFNSLEGLGPVERDAAFKKKAIENIKQNPKKFAYNWIANWGRTFFSHPLSFLKPSNGLFVYLLPNMFLIVFSITAGYFWLRHPTLFPVEILALMLMVSIYLLGTSLLSSYVRFLFPVIPVMLVWIAFGLNRFVRFEIPLAERSNPDQP